MNISNRTKLNTYTLNEEKLNESDVPILAKTSAHDKKIKKSDKTRHNSNFFDELNHAKSYQT